MREVAEARTQPGTPTCSAKRATSGIKRQQPPPPTAFAPLSLNSQSAAAPGVTFDGCHPGMVHTPGSDTAARSDPLKNAAQGKHLVCLTADMPLTPCDIFN